MLQKIVIKKGCPRNCRDDYAKKCFWGKLCSKYDFNKYCMIKYKFVLLQILQVYCVFLRLTRKILQFSRKIQNTQLEAKRYKKRKIMYYVCDRDAWFCCLWGVGDPNPIALF